MPDSEEGPSAHKPLTYLDRYGKTSKKTKQWHSTAECLNVKNKLFEKQKRFYEWTCLLTETWKQDFLITHDYSKVIINGTLEI